MLLRVVPIARPLCARCLTHYDVLGIPRTATKSDIKKAYLEKAKECHPDLNPDNERAAVKFQEIQEAHDVLMNSKARAQYNHQLNQESYYGSQQTHRPEDGPRRSKVRTHGVNNQYYSRGVGNDDFHENHRVNNDNYSYPGSDRARYTDPYTGNLSTSVTDHQHIIYMASLGGVALFLYGAYQIILGIQEEANEGRHGKSKMVHNAFAQAKKQMESSNSPGMWAKLSVSERGSEPVVDNIRYVWSEEKGKLVRMNTLKGHGQLKDKFDDTIQKNLGEAEEIVEEIAEINKPVTMAEISLLRIEMSKKKSEYLAAKKEYSEKLELFEEEQKNKKSKRKKHEVV